MFYLIPHGKSSIGYKWIFKIKYHDNGKIGKIERYKARLVTKIYTQITSIDNLERTYILVFKLTTIRLILALSFTNNCHIYQFNVHNTFLHCDLQ